MGNYIYTHKRNPCTDEEIAQFKLDTQREEIVDEILDIASLYIDEPAGTGCGYGFSQEAEAEILELFEQFGVHFKERNERQD